VGAGSKWTDAGTRALFAEETEPLCPLEVWNNAGLAFLAKGRHAAALVCLLKASQLDSAAWVTQHNLGLAYLHTGQPASAFRALSAALALKPTNAQTYMLAGVALSQLGDLPNATLTYERALALDPDDPLIYLNYCCALVRHGTLSARLGALYQAFSQRWRGGRDEGGQLTALRTMISKALAQQQQQQQHAPAGSSSKAGTGAESSSKGGSGSATVDAQRAQPQPQPVLPPPVRRPARDEADAQPPVPPRRLSISRVDHNPPPRS
jgi:tetratricopeptide (TPR) repeat protein